MSLRTPSAAAFVASVPFLFRSSPLSVTARRPLVYRSIRHNAHVPPLATASVPTCTSPLVTLRTLLQQHNLSAYIIPTNDPHNSEYSPPHYARRAYISGFTGSAGTAVVTLDGAYLWTDGRYFLQAENQLGNEWTLMKTGVDDTPDISQFLADNVGGRIGIDPFVHAVENVDEIRDKVEPVGGSVVTVESNLVDLIWEDRPPLGEGKVRVHDVKYAGRSVMEKIEALREEMEKKECQHVLFCMLDEVCWMFNVRGDDIPHCPVVLSYGLVSENEARFYVDKSKVSEEVEQSLNAQGVHVVSYEQVLNDVREIAEGGERIWYDPGTVSLALGEAAGEGALKETTTIPMEKARKNEAELAGMREAHLKDGVALCGFLCWLEEEVKGGGKVSEVAAAARLEGFRAMQNGFLTTSFETIAGSGSNGAIIHYSPQEGECGFVNENEVFLLDSGGQYVDGTTDVTRTMQLGGKASEYEKECFTRVLKGHIAIDTAVFPEDTTGLMLDSLARLALWNVGLDFRHGTGHGVGACLNVHEGPQGISPRPSSNKVGLKEGMIVSNEPGYYEEDGFGIRIENLLVVVEKKTPYEFGEKKFLGFERLTFAPIDRDMIDGGLLNEKERRWVDAYHEEVWNKLSPRMENGKYKEWLWEKTRPLVTDPAGSQANVATESNGVSGQRTKAASGEKST